MKFRNKFPGFPVIFISVTPNQAKTFLKRERSFDIFIKLYDQTE